MFDVGDLPVLTFGNCVLKAGVIKWPVKLKYVFYVFNVFFHSGVTTGWTGVDMWTLQFFYFGHYK